MSEDVWNDGVLGEAFDVDNNSSFENESSDINKQADNKISNDKISSKYPHNNTQEARESLKRAAENEQYDEFKKVANAIEDQHPEALNNIDKLSEVSYAVGKNIAEGIYDQLADQF